MLASLQILVVTAVITSLIYSALPNRWVEVRRVLVLGVSAVVIYSFNPRTLAIVFVVTALAWGLYAIARRHPTRLWIPWLVMLPLVVNAVTEVMLGRNWGDILPFPTGSPSTPMLTSLATLGLSFYSFKLYASIKEGVHDGALPFRDLLTTTLFFPAFPIGPIDSAKRFNRSALAAEPSARNWVKGAARIGIGAFKVFVLTQMGDDRSPDRVGRTDSDGPLDPWLHGSALGNRIHDPRVSQSLSQLLGFYRYRDWHEAALQFASLRELPLSTAEHVNPALLAALESDTRAIYHDLHVQADAAQDRTSSGLADRHVYADWALA